MIYEYQCPDCGSAWELRHGMQEQAPLYCVCGTLTTKAFTRPRIITGTRFVNQEQRLRRPYVIREKDGSETVYTSVQQVKNQEGERNDLSAPNNVARLTKQGYVPGTWQADFADACDNAPR